MNREALGMVETKGLIGSIEAADAMVTVQWVKTAAEECRETSSNKTR